MSKEETQLIWGIVFYFFDIYCCCF